MRKSLTHLRALWLVIAAIVLSSHVRLHAAETPTLESLQLAEWMRLSDTSGKVLVKFNITNPVPGSRIDDLHIVKHGGQEATTVRLNDIDASVSPVIVEMDLKGLESNGKTPLYVKGQYHDKDGKNITFTSNAKNMCGSWKGTKCDHGYSFDNNIGEVSTAIADFKNPLSSAATSTAPTKKAKKAAPQDGSTL